MDSGGKQSKGKVGLNYLLNQKINRENKKKSKKEKKIKQKRKKRGGGGKENSTESY